MTRPTTAAPPATLVDLFCLLASFRVIVCLGETGTKPRNNAIEQVAGRRA